MVEIVEQWDLAGLTGQIRGAGAAAYHPEMLLGLLIYDYATGTFGSRRIEQATYDSLAFRTLAANTHPDHALCTFRKRFLPEIERLFVAVLRLAQPMKLLKLARLRGFEGLARVKCLKSHDGVSLDLHYSEVADAARTGLILGGGCTGN